MTECVYEDDLVELYVGDMRELLPRLCLKPDLIVTDPPYAQTSLAWDRWPTGWVQMAAEVCTSMWCFGTFRMFLEHHDEFDTAGWKISQDVVWEKNHCSGCDYDRFLRVHELATHWYRGLWRDVRHEVPMVLDGDKGRLSAKARKAESRMAHRAGMGARQTEYVREAGERMAKSVLMVRNTNGLAIHPTEKPTGILDPLITYGCPEGGLVLDLFAGSGSTLEAARMLGRRAVGIEADKDTAEEAAQRLAGVPASAIKAVRRGRAT